MSEPPRIRVLGDHVINKIAAGEVVDRPASVVKELVENALDAGAKQIEIETVAGGRSLIRVADDGSGMSRDDALLSIERHATSKIRDVDDIEGIATLGFRGEALAAVAAVSRFELQTAVQGAVSGTAIRTAGGRILDVSETGAPAGTQITVRNLFFNVPARRKFLRTEQTEGGHVRQVILLYALACPDVAFLYKADGREVYRLPACADTQERIRALFSIPSPDALRRVHTAAGGARLHGFAALPSLSRADRSDQYLFVNRRPAQAPILFRAVREAYETLLPTGRQPMVFLFLDLPASDVDVNVHPTKKEVRFRRANAVRDLVLGGLRSALSVRATAEPIGGAEPPTLQSTARPAEQLSITDLPAAHVFNAPRFPPPTDMASDAPAGPGGDGPSPQAPAAPGGPEVRTEDAPWAWCRVLGQVGGLFVVLETEDGLVLMDPHAAHERVLFEQFMAQVSAGRIQSQGLLSPETLELTPAEAAQVRDNLPLLADLGFGISDFGGDAFIVDAAPAVFGALPVRDMLREAAYTADRSGPRGNRERWSRDRIAMAACKAAVKARDRLTLAEMEKLVRDLAAASMPYTCPHGRPTLIHLSYHDLRRQFGRT